MSQFDQIVHVQCRQPICQLPKSRKIAGKLQQTSFHGLINVEEIIANPDNSEQWAWFRHAVVHHTYVRHAIRSEGIIDSLRNTQMEGHGYLFERRYFTFQTQQKFGIYFIAGILYPGQPALMLYNGGVHDGALEARENGLRRGLGGTMGRGLAASPPPGGEIDKEERGE